MMITTKKTLKQVWVIVLIISMMINLVLPFSSYANDETTTNQVVFEVPKGEEGVQLGDYVFYSPYTYMNHYLNHEYSFGGWATGMPYTQYMAAASNTFGMWRVVGYSDTIVDVVPVYHIETSGLWLKGNNAMYNIGYGINEACENLYSYYDLGIQARSINIDDFFKYLTDEAIGILFSEGEIKLEEKYLTNPAAVVLYHNEELDMADELTLDNEANDGVALSNVEEAKLNYKDNSYWIINPYFSNDSSFVTYGIPDYIGTGATGFSTREMKRIMREECPLFKLDDGVLSIVDLHNPEATATTGQSTSGESMDIMQDFINRYLSGVDKEEVDKYMQYNFVSPVLTIDKEILESDDEKFFTVAGQERIDIPVINMEYSPELIEEVFKDDETFINYGLSFFVNFDVASQIINYMNTHDDYKYHVMSNDAVFGLYTDEQCTNLVSVSKPYTINNLEFPGLYAFEDVPNSNFFIKQLKEPSGYKLNNNPANMRNLALQSDKLFNYTLNYLPYNVDYSSLFYGIEDNGLASLSSNGRFDDIWGRFNDILGAPSEIVVQIFPFMAKYMTDEAQYELIGFNAQYGIKSIYANLFGLDSEPIGNQDDDGSGITLPNQQEVGAIDLSELSEEQRKAISDFRDMMKECYEKYLLSGVLSTNRLNFEFTKDITDVNILKQMYHMDSIYGMEDYGHEEVMNILNSKSLKKKNGTTGGPIGPNFYVEEEDTFRPNYFFNEKVEIFVDKLDENGNRLVGAELAIIDPETNEIVKSNDYTFEKDETTYTSVEEAQERLMNGQELIHGDIGGYIGLHEKEKREGFDDDKSAGGIHERSDVDFYVEYVLKSMVNIGEFMLLPKSNGSINVLMPYGPIKDYGYEDSYTLYENTILDRGILDLFGIKSNLEETEIKWTTDNNQKTIDYLAEGKEYILRELKAPDGYKIAEDLRFIVEDGKIVTLNNELTETKFSFYEGEDEEDLAGAKIAIYDGENLVERFTSTEEPYIKEGLVEGKEYTVKVESVPDGLLVPEDMTITISEGLHVKIRAEKVLTDITVVKVDEETNEPIKAEFEFTLYEDEACTKELKVVKTNAETGKATFEDLPYGTYYIKETKTAEGYVKSDKVEVVVIDSSLQGVGDNYEFTFGNKPVEVIIVKKDEKGNVLPGAKLQVLVKENDEVLDEYTTTAASHRITHLIEGRNYILRELKAPTGYDKAEDIVFTAKDGKVVEMIDKEKILTVKVNIVDKDTKETIKNQEFKLDIYANEELTDKVENAVITYDYTKGTAQFANVPYGEYYVKETVYPKGYEQSSDVVKVVYDDTTENNTIEITIENEPVKMNMGDIEGKSRNNIIGAEIEVYDKETNELVDKWTTKDEIHTIKNLVIGRKYVMKQVYVPDDYYKADDIEFIAENGTNVIMKNEKVLTNVIVSLIDQDTSKPIVNKTFGFRIYKDEECKHEAAFVRINTSDATATILELEKGTYYVKQVEVPEGYEVLEDKVLKLEINKNLDEYGNILNLVVKNKVKKAEPAKEENKGAPAAQPAAQPAPQGTTVIVNTGSGSGNGSTTKTYTSSSTGKVDPDTVEKVRNVPDTDNESNKIFYRISGTMLVIGLGLIVVALKKKE